MNTATMGSLDATTAASAVNASSTKTAVQAAGQAAGNPSFEEVFRLAMMSGDAGDISAQAKSLMQERGVSPALALLGY